MEKLKYFVFNSGEANEAGQDWNVNSASPGFPLAGAAAPPTDRSHAGLVRLDNAYASQLARFGLDRPLLPRRIPDAWAEDDYWPAPGRYGYALMPWGPEFCLAGIYTGGRDHRGRRNISLLMAAVPGEIRQKTTPQEFFSGIRRGNDVDGILTIRATEEQKKNIVRPDWLELPPAPAPLSGAAPDRLGGWPDSETLKILVNGRLRTLTAVPDAEIRPAAPEPERHSPPRPRRPKLLAAGLALCAALGGWAWFSGGSPEPLPRDPVPANLQTAPTGAAPENTDSFSALIRRAAETGCQDQDASCTVYAAQLKGDVITVIRPPLWAPASGQTELKDTFTAERGSVFAVSADKLRGLLKALFAGDDVEYVRADSPEIFNRNWDRNLAELKKSLAVPADPPSPVSSPDREAVRTALLDSAKTLPEGSCLAFASGRSDGITVIRLVSLSDGSLIGRRSCAADGYIAVAPKEMERWIGRLEGKYLSPPCVSDGDNGHKIIRSKKELTWTPETWKHSVESFMEELIEQL
ncbi:hypothetical protein [Pyramidobacter sp.]|uniref:hypothetical protein n=1 Tax=Pyramidobacter sp. TaxID=1943581 RepID=UPI00332785DC